MSVLQGFLVTTIDPSINGLMGGLVSGWVGGWMEHFCLIKIRGAFFILLL